MSFKPQLIGTLPEETVRVAHAAFHKGNLYLTLRYEIGTLYNDTKFTALYRYCQLNPTAVELY